MCLASFPLFVISFFSFLVYPPYLLYPLGRYGSTRSVDRGPSNHSLKCVGLARAEYIRSPESRRGWRRRREQRWSPGKRTDLTSHSEDCVVSDSRTTASEYISKEGVVQYCYSLLHVATALFATTHCCGSTGKRGFSTLPPDLI